jgi:hypothetical protein
MNTGDQTQDQSWPEAWEPLSPRGVAAFANASLGRLLVVQCSVAFLAAVAIMWFISTAWFPVVRTAIEQLPSEGEFRDGELYWSGENSLQLAENRFLGLAVDLEHSGQLGRESNLQVELGRDDFRVFSLLGYQTFSYPPTWIMPFNQPEFEPWWGAWSPYLRASAGLITFVALMIAWSLLATIYCVPVRVISFLQNRDLDWAQSWCLAGAALMPGAIFLIAGICGYALQWIDLIGLAGVMALHLVIGWIYVFVAPLFCPRPPEIKKLGDNPFAGQETKIPTSKTKAKKSNPFAGPPSQM